MRARARARARARVRALARAHASPADSRFRYEGGGYRVLLPNDATEATAALDALRALRWIDLGTRAVFIKCYMYSNALQTLVSVQYLVEFPAAGGTVVSGKIQPMKINQLYLLDETIRAITLEAVMLFGVLVYVAIEFRLM